LIVAVVNLKGGVGKSTSAVYFATVASGGGEVVVLDADTERSALEWAAAGELPFEVVPAERDRLARQARELEGREGAS
jgi:chromosome partitioning protein